MTGITYTAIFGAPTIPSGMITETIEATAFLLATAKKLIGRQASNIWTSKHYVGHGVAPDAPDR